MKRHARAFLAALTPSLLVALILLAPSGCHAQARRVVVVKADGLPFGLVDRYARERDPRTGKSQLPWIEEVFYRQGTRVSNFYVRGMSLSAPSWSLLDTGQHLQIKGNVEFDRYTLRSYDYLNFIPFYFGSALGMHVDTPGPELLDQIGVPLLVDAFTHGERYTSFQLHQRGLSWNTLQLAARNRLRRTPRELVDEWTVGMDARDIVTAQTEREIVERLNDPRQRYFDIKTVEYDHAAHHNNDPETQLAALKHIDGMVGRVWAAIQKSDFADETALIVVSDHGFNSDRRVYSQGFNLVKLLGSAEGGGHHVITKRRLLLDYSIKGINPFVPLITTTTEQSYYLKGLSTDYPTALLDFDGNERSSIYLRDGDLNVLHILLQQLKRKDLPQPLRRALASAFFETLGRRRGDWEAELSGLKEGLEALRRLIEKQRAEVQAQPKKWGKDDQDNGRDLAARRVSAQLGIAKAEEQEYAAFARALTNLLALKADTFDPARLNVEDLIAKRAIGDRNNIHRLQSYVVGVAPGGFVLKADGSLDTEKSFARVDYFALLHNASVRNNVQPGVASRPVDFTATRVPLEQIAPALDADDLRPNDDVIWINGGPESQALLLARVAPGGGLSLRYLPVSGLTQDAGGVVRFKRTDWRDRLPLRIWEDAALSLPAGATREEWLAAWHTDVEWLRALHKTEYSNGLIGLHEQLDRHPPESLNADAPGLSADERLLRGFRLRQRGLVEPDLLVMANN
ncbi:MAG TPA: alkaline phosphatase family protein, partial [Pyrinomonadaceae bacterium]